MNYTEIETNEVSATAILAIAQLTNYTDKEAESKVRESLELSNINLDLVLKELASAHNKKCNRLDCAECNIYANLKSVGA